MNQVTRSVPGGFRNEPRTPITVEQYSQQLFAKVLRNGFSPDEKENEKLSSKHLYSLTRKLAAAGEREDVKIPLRVLRDEIANVYRTYPRSSRDRAVETLFHLYDGLNTELTEGSMTKNVVSEEDVKQIEMIHEELRLRVYLLVTGETWRKLPQLQMMALKRLYRYMMEEILLSRTGSGPRILNPMSKKRQISQKISHKIVGPDARSWESVFSDLCKASGTKLVPLIRNLLDEVDLLQTQLETAAGADHSSQVDIASEDIPDPVRISGPSTSSSEHGTSGTGDVSGMLLELSEDASTVPQAELQTGSLTAVNAFPEVFDPFPPEASLTGPDAYGKPWTTDAYAQGSGSGATFSGGAVEQSFFGARHTGGTVAHHSQGGSSSSGPFPTSTPMARALYPQKNMQGAPMNPSVATAASKAPTPVPKAALQKDSFGLEDLHLFDATRT